MTFLKNLWGRWVATAQRQWSIVFEGGGAEVFSPTMLQIQAAPPAPLARAIAATTALCLMVFIAWSLWADFDVVVSSTGSAVASSKTKVVQALEAGRVVAIHVKDGDTVEKGMPVVALDATVAAADREKTEQESLEALLDVHRLNAQLKGRSALEDVPAQVSAELVERQNHLLASRKAEQEQRIAVLRQEAVRKASEMKFSAANIQKIAATLPILQQRLEMREKLLKEGFIAEISVIDSRLEVAAQQSELTVQKEKLKESESATMQAQAEYVSRTAAELNDAQRRLHSGQREWVKAAYRESYQLLSSPIGGTVQQLAVHTVGGVVNPGQSLMTVVPREEGIDVEAQVPNKDVGFLRVGMPVTVKLDAFEFTKYGALEGVVQWIGADAVKDDKLGTYYPVRVSLKNTRLPVSVGDQHPEVRIGMSVTVDIAIGQRKAYEFFLGPLLKYKNESLRER